EFEEVRVKIRVAKFNRKFTTLEHEIYDSSNHLLGKGEQSLMFVSSADYGLIDIPQEVLAAFAVYT
ncbi:MAG: acyl-CoA thioesterase, partial [bacterium]